MSYSVNWDEDALSALAAIWVLATDRPAVNKAQESIDRLLAGDPLANGAPLKEGLFALEVPPLRALFELSTEEKSVRVVSVRPLS
jgi:hypothetical protein